MLADVRTELLRYKALAEGAIDQVQDAELMSAQADGSNSIAVICQHVAGNLISRFTDFLTTDGEKPWRRRDTEFVPTLATRRELLARWDEGWRVLFASLDDLSDADLDRPVAIRGQSMTARTALIRALAHVSYHVGQIVFIAKAARGTAWDSLSIPPGQSEAYNKALRRNPPT